MKNISNSVKLLLPMAIIWGTLATSCAAPAPVDEPMQIQMLQADDATLQARLKLLKREKDADLYRVEELREELQRAEAAAPSLVSGGEHPYLAIHADYLRRAINSFLPAGISRDDFNFSFQDSIIDRSREEVRISITFQVRSHRLSSVAGGGTSNGRLTGIIKPWMGDKSDWLQLVFIPRTIQIEGVYGSTEVDIISSINLDWFDHLIPPIPAPMLPGYGPGDRGAQGGPVQIQFMTDKYLVLFERIIIPFKFTDSN